ncbi:twin-arginine translocase TatA/TatE family subunit [Oceaniglobus trochenteri]|uniref:twin-arginine translocase TatA/TatE family subunit n=1 Tax=Oceaniglobus trochenteri TaxID=2763260 RepID=UPI001CFF5EA4|nr:twin-arginine translocase TatA/TatE family subunit [Oceaniglobus trochenteri]
MLNNIGLPGLLLIAVVVLVLFGRGKISSLMGEVGKGITAFKRGVSDGTKELDDVADAEKADKAEDRRVAPPAQGDAPLSGQATRVDGDTTADKDKV